MEEVSSPLTGGASRLERTLSVAAIVEGYRRTVGTDISRFFDGIDQLQLRRCDQTGYGFFWPVLMGDSDFYADLSRHDWFYKQDKWEYDQATNYLAGAERLLDIGAGRGHFLSKAARLGIEPHGLEFNQQAVAEATSAGLSVEACLIDDHARQRPAYYDVVTSFQVLEHVPDPKSFIAACVDVLKPGGKLIFGVPNDAGFVGLDDTVWLNRPPHHLSLWRPDSLRALTELFPLDLAAMDYEPLAEVDWYTTVMIERYLPGGWRRRLFERLGGRSLLRRAVEENRESIHGHTVLAVYVKRA